MTDPAFATLLDAARTAHAAHPALMSFCPFPEDLSPLPVTPHHIPAAELMAREPAFQDENLDPLARAFLDASPVATWRETYKATSIGQSFLDQFGCYCLIGPQGGFHSNQIRTYVVYMPKGLHYPWHHHPAEELYVILAGEAEFHREGSPSERLGCGDVSIHTSNQPHATTTHDQPMLAYVVWRNHLDTPPVLTEMAALR